MSRELQRQFMRSQGFAFCDDQQQRIKEISAEYLPVREGWELDSSRYQSLIVKGVKASSTDDAGQSIRKSLHSCTWEQEYGSSGTIVLWNIFVWASFEPPCSMQTIYAFASAPL